MGRNPVSPYEVELTTGDKGRGNKSSRGLFISRLQCRQQTLWQNSDGKVHFVNKLGIFFVERFVFQRYWSGGLVWSFMVCSSLELMGRFNIWEDGYVYPGENFITYPNQSLKVAFPVA